MHSRNVLKISRPAANLCSWYKLFISRRFKKVYLEVENSKNNLELLAPPTARQTETYMALEDKVAGLRKTCKKFADRVNLERLLIE